MNNGIKFLTWNEMLGILYKSHGIICGYVICKPNYTEQTWPYPVLERTYEISYTEYRMGDMKICGKRISDGFNGIERLTGHDICEGKLTPIFCVMREDGQKMSHKELMDSITNPHRPKFPEGVHSNFGFLQFSEEMIRKILNAQPLA